MEDLARDGPTYFADWRVDFGVATPESNSSGSFMSPIASTVRLLRPRLCNPYPSRGIPTVPLCASHIPRPSSTSALNAS
jgi:hypothetical protein